MPRLVLLSEGYTGRTYELKTEKTTVGRLEDNTFQIPDGSVSSHHCEILLQGPEVVVRDLNSTNGTYIGGERITEAVLKPGQVLRLGMVEMRLESGQPATPAKRKLDHTIVIPQGVKLNELEGPRPTTLEGKSGFEKKSNKGALTFIIGASVLFLLLLIAIIYILLTKRPVPSPPVRPPPARAQIEAPRPPPPPSGLAPGAAALAWATQPVFSQRATATAL